MSVRRISLRGLMPLDIVQEACVRAIPLTMTIPAQLADETELQKARDVAQWTECLPSSH